MSNWKIEDGNYSLLALERLPLAVEIGFLRERTFFLDDAFLPSVSFSSVPPNSSVPLSNNLSTNVSANESSLCGAFNSFLAFLPS